MKASLDCIELIKRFEGCRLEQYNDVAGLKTIGIGHLIKPGESFDTLTQDEADVLLMADLAQFEQCVSNLVRVPINQNEFDALVSFAFNLGCRALQNSTLLKMVNIANFESAANEFLRWDFAGGKKVKGLTNRRIAEREKFLS